MKKYIASIFVLQWVFICPVAISQQFEGGTKQDLVPPSFLCESNRKCEFNFKNEQYGISKNGELYRKGSNNYRNKIFKKGDKLKSASLSDTGNIIAVNIANTKQSSRSFGGGIRPDDLDRSYRVAMYNPKSGSLIKEFDLGAFNAKSVTLSSDGQLLYLFGQNVEHGSEKEVRVYNARSGRLVESKPYENDKHVFLATNGFGIKSNYYKIQTIDVNKPQIYNSSDPFSIAEYQISCSNKLVPSKLNGNVGMSQISDKANDQGEMIASALSSHLSKFGLDMVERNKMKEILEEIQFSTLGLTEQEASVDIGKLGVAKYLIFGESERSEESIFFNVRLISVETGTEMSSCTKICRDCEDKDFFEGVLKLAEHWAKP